MLADTIVFSEAVFAQEKFQEVFYVKVSDPQDGVIDAPVTLVERLAMLCGNRMANQQNMLAPNRRMTLNYRSVLGLFFRDYVPEAFHQEIRTQLSESLLGTGWLPGLYSPFSLPSDDISTFDLLGDYKPEFPDYDYSWQWNLNIEKPNYDPDGKLLHYAHFETRNKQDLFDAYMAKWTHPTGTPLPTQESHVDTIWEMLMLGFIELLDEHFLPIVLADPLNTDSFYYFRNGRTWRQIESEKWMRVLHDSLPEHFAKILKKFFNEVFLLENLPKCRIEPVPPQNWELTIAEEKAQRHNLLAFCPTLDPNEILIPGEIVGFSSQSAEYSLPAVDMYNRPVYDKNDKRVIDKFTWRYALVTAPPAKYTVNVCGTPKVGVYVYEMINTLVRKKIRDYVLK